MNGSSSKFVWYPDARCGFAIGKLIDIGQTHVTVQPVAWPAASGLGFDHQPQVSNCSDLNSNNNNNSNQHHPSKHETVSTTTPLEFPYKSVYPCDQFELLDSSDHRRVTTNGGVLPAQLEGVDDSCALIQLNEAALLENVRVRFHRDKIYTYVAHILIAVNPYNEIKGLHSADAIARYQGKSLGTMPPHVYAIADKAYRDMKAFKQSQSIIISGESGAGKTESQKYVLRYLCLSGSQSGRLEKLILDANPILEAFGNAKTIRNNNSSRFGKFIEIHYEQRFTVTGGLFFHYLLEKSRICTQSPGERNYHIFYQLCACLPEQQWLELELDAPDKFHYLNGGDTRYFCSGGSDQDSKLIERRKSRLHASQGAIQDQLIDDLKCYKQTDEALANFGLDDEQKFAIYSIVAAVLHLGNIAFCDDPDDNRGGCRLERGSEKSLNSTGRLIGLEPDLLRQALVSRIMSTARAGNKGTVYMVQLNQQQAQAARDALAKAIYSRLFDHIVTKIVNKSIPFASSAYYIGVLDVAGFEYFQHNSFEQFLINFCNEKLQQFFNERILKEEQSIYEKEGLNLTRVEYVDNQDCIELFEMKSRGIFDLLDEESRLPKPSAQHFTQGVHEAHRGHFRLALPRTSKLKLHREIRDDEGFLVRHFAGAVCYETHSFIEKNNDALHASLRSLMLESENKLMRELFSTPMNGQHNNNQETTGLSSSTRTGGANFQLQTAGGVNSNKLNFISVGTTFRSQLNELMHKLRSTGSHFIRCIKPNNEMVAHKFVGAQILSQLHCSGMDSVLKLMQQGYPSRLSFHDLYQAYKQFLPPELARLDAHLFCRALFKAIGLSDQDFRFGSSKVFFRPAKFAEFDQIIRTSDSEHMAGLIKQVSRWLIRSSWRRVQYCALSAVKLTNKILFRRAQIVRIQRNWRTALIQRRIKFRLDSIKAARQVITNLVEFEQIIRQQLKQTNERDNLEEESHLLREEVDRFIESLRNSIKMILEVSGDEKQASSPPMGTSETQNYHQNLAASYQDKTSCERHLELLRTKRDLLIRSIRDKIAKQKELAQLERQLAEERQRREAEELAKRNEEQTKRQRNELETRRQAEAELLANGSRANGNQDQRQQQQQAKQQLASRKLVDSATDPISFNAMNYEQEQRDYEIALRLAQDLGGATNRKDSLTSNSSGLATVTTPRAPSVSPAELGNSDGQLQRYNLTKWKYSDLRDTINTSCDLELLEACKREFHRRLKVYHAWRAMNSAQQQHQPNQSSIQGQRAPSCIMNQSAGACDERFLGHGGSSNETTNALLEPEQRYFRIPFLKPGSASAASGGQRGWWFAHFDGQWIARQLELHPNREPILLVAGKHDIDMCELSLNETRLTSKRGAEILAAEFEAEWRKHGGEPYKRRM
uniref:Myosin heavy chain 95F n=1 Tax=Aceria tosichella TaxID=561515 RepID=A0A6G1S8K6_9ACAR